MAATVRTDNPRLGHTATVDRVNGRLKTRTSDTLPPRRTGLGDIDDFVIIIRTYLYVIYGFVGRGVVWGDPAVLLFVTLFIATLLGLFEFVSGRKIRFLPKKDTRKIIKSYHINTHNKYIVIVGFNQFFLNRDMHHFDDLLKAQKMIDERKNS